jgi:hypothetical protein
VNLAHLPLNASIRVCMYEMSFTLGEDGTGLVDNTISADDILAGFNRLSEDLSSSPSGRHLGHYKAALDDPELCSMYE